MLIRTLIVLCMFSASAVAQSAELAFKLDKPGEYVFDTGKLSGRLLATEKGEGIVSLVDKASGVELAKGQQVYGIFSLYRLLGPNARWGAVIWDWPKTAELLPDGGVRIAWAPTPEHPASIAATYRWSAADTLDLEIAIEPKQDMPGIELFVGSYFNATTKSLVYVAPTRHMPAGPGEFLAADACPLTIGAYLVFPRDLKATQMIYDGRWEQGLHPVHWSTTRFMAGPLALREDAKSGVGMAIMSRPQDCFAVECAYNPNLSADPVANHHSTYLSLFGKDIKAGQTAKACARLVVRKELVAADAVAAYEGFAKEKK